MVKWSIGQSQLFAICYEVLGLDLKEAAFAPDGTSQRSYTTKMKEAELRKWKDPSIP